MRSPAGASPPSAVTRGDAPGFLLRELRAATTPGYKKILIDRLFIAAPRALAGEIRRALPTENDWSVQRAYRKALERLSARGASTEQGTAPQP
jgi:hypothetical protein